MSANIQPPDALTARVLSLAVIGPDERRRRAVMTALTKAQSGPVTEFFSYPSRVDEASQLLKRNYDVVMVDLDSSMDVALEVVENISLFGTASIIVYSEYADPELMLRCMRAGAREFLHLPLTNDTVIEALLRVSSRRPAAQAEKKAEGGLYVFLGAKGGAGVTTLACNFAVSLAQESEKSTLLIDLNLPLGDAAINLGVQSQYSTVDALQNSSRLDTNFLSSLLVQHSSGLFVLSAPGLLTAIQCANDAVDRLLEVARQNFAYVVVDAGSRLDLQRTALFHEYATIYLVTQVGIPELRNANRLVTQFSHQGSPKLEIVLNRNEPGANSIQEEQVTKALTKPPQWRIPNDYAAVRRMQNTATPLVLEDSPIARIIRQMARVVCGKPELPEKKKKFGLFG